MGKDGSNYGLGLHLNVPVFKPFANDTLGVKAGWGACVFGDRPINNNWGYRIHAGFDQSKYLHDIDNTITIFNNGNLTSLALYFPEQMSETQFQIGLTGNYSFIGTREVLDGTKSSGVRRDKYRPPARGDIGLVLGIAFELKPHLLLRFNYTEYLISKQHSDFIDGRPDQVQIGLDIRFNKLDEINTRSDYSVAYNQLNDLTNGKMIFMLSTRSSEINAIADSVKKADFIKDLNTTHENLVKAIYRHYKYSDFLICYDTSVDKFGESGTYEVFLDSNMNRINGVIDGYRLYGHVGENFYSEYRRSATGIYIYDTEFVMLKSPFPYFIKYRERSDSENDYDNIEKMILDLNHSLFDQQSLISPRFDK